MDEMLDNYFYMYMPSAILVLGAIVVLFGNAFAGRFSRNTSLSLCMIFIAAAFVFCLSVGHAIDVSRIVFVAELIILVAAFWFMFLVFSKHEFVEFQTPEFYPLYLLSIAGFMLMVNTNNFILVLLGLEIGSLPLAALLAFNRRIYGIEASIKYFVASALASIFFILGIMLLYLYSGSFELTAAMSRYKVLIEPSPLELLLLLFGVIFIFAGLGFKVSLVPWHSWMPDVYEAANPVLAGYVSVIPKIAGFAVFASMFEVIFRGALVVPGGYVETLFKILLVITITVPNVAALIQKDVKRMLAFSSVSHSGFALACVYLGAFETLALYWILFLITNLGAFALLWANKPRDFQSRFDYPFERFYGYGKKHPIMALGIALFMLSLAGVPPFSIFWGKIFIITTALQKNEMLLMFAMIINSAIAVCYYLRLIVAMYFKAPIIGQDNLYEDNSTVPMCAVIFICALLCIGSVFVVSYLSKIMPLLAS